MGRLIKKTPFQGFRIKLRSKLPNHLEKCAKLKDSLRGGDLKYLLPAFGTIAVLPYDFEWLSLKLLDFFVVHEVETEVLNGVSMLM
ncbi:hypothetical protein CEXT_559941 [Caerostris extrusa]|uniref:Uncharacterized protein n=1 Tax=Caerostris extrusa TaxID=172846 RepID=A0AAV4TZ02_CAEEX|nr:hypothetical protein CEXT_559941 [Caerostris extrusa]